MQPVFAELWQTGFLILSLVFPPAEKYRAEEEVKGENIPGEDESITPNEAFYRVKELVHDVSRHVGRKEKAD